MWTCYLILFSGRLSGSFTYFALRGLCYEIELSLMRNCWIGFEKEVRSRVVFKNYHMIPIIILFFEFVAVNLTASLMYKSNLFPNAPTTYIVPSGNNPPSPQGAYSTPYTSGHQLGTFSKEYWQPSANRTVISYFAKVLRISSCH